MWFNSSSRGLIKRYRSSRIFLNLPLIWCKCEEYIIFRRYSRNLLLQKRVLLPIRSFNKGIPIPAPYTQIYINIGSSPSRLWTVFRAHGASAITAVVRKRDAPNLSVFITFSCRDGFWRLPAACGKWKLSTTITRLGKGESNQCDHSFMQKLTNITLQTVASDSLFVSIGMRSHFVLQAYLEQCSVLFIQLTVT